MATTTTNDSSLSLLQAYRSVRAHTDVLTAPLSDEDQCIQSMPDVSPTKWHRAHVTWFFETFLCKPHLDGYAEHDPAFGFLFNSYSETIGQRHPRPERGNLSRPSCAQVAAYRRHVDEAMGRLLTLELDSTVTDLVTLGLHHEQQHQELILMDVKHVLSRNPALWPAYRAPGKAAPAVRTGADEGAVDCAGETRWAKFDGGGWQVFTLEGMKPVAPAEPVCHLSSYEADAFARWAGARLPTEFEWEHAVTGLPRAGNIGSCASLHPVPAAGPKTASGNEPVELQQMYGDVWEWTSSPHAAYPGFRVAPGAVGEVVLRRPRQRPVRPDHPPRGVLPDTPRARDPRSGSRCHRGGLGSRVSRGARIWHFDQDAHPARRVRSCRPAPAIRSSSAPISSRTRVASKPRTTTRRASPPSST